MELQTLSKHFYKLVPFVLNHVNIRKNREAVMSIPNRGLNVLRFNEERLNSAKFLALAKKRSHEERDVVEIDDK